MSTTYEATLRGNLLEWHGEAPRGVAPGKAVNVRVIVVDEAPTRRGPLMAQALERLAQSSALAGVEAARWERGVRTERALPGREE